MSTASLYPMKTEDSLDLVGKMGFRTAEVFLNSCSELTPEFVAKLCEIRDRYSLRICAVHPFTSFMESFFIFGTYSRRFADIKGLYEKYFEVAAMLGADVVTMHGAKGKNNAYEVEEAEAFERFGELALLAKSRSVTLAQENVYSHSSASPKYMKRMADALGDSFAAVLDVKQAYKSGFAPQEFIDAVGKRIIHVHLSDHNGQSNCLLPGKGEYDFTDLFASLLSIGYNREYIIELYCDSYDGIDSLPSAKTYLQKCFAVAEKAFGAR